MRRNNPIGGRLGLLLLAGLMLGESAQTGHGAEVVTPAFQRALANASGKKLVVVRLDYAPGAKSKPHQILAPAKRDSSRLYRARLLHFTAKGAQAACTELHRKGIACSVVRPGGLKVATG